MSEPAPGRRGPTLAVTAAVVALLAGYLWTQRQHIASEYALRPGGLLAISGLTAAVLALRGLQNQLVFGRLGVRAPLGDWIGLVTVASFSNYLPLSAGLVAKALYLKRVHATPYRRFAVGQGGILLLVLLANGALGLALLIPRSDSPAEAAVTAGFALMAAVGLTLWLPERAGQRLTGGRLARDLAAARELRRAGPGALACQLVVLVLTAGALRLAFDMGAARVDFQACLIFSAAAVLTSLVSVTPGGLGIREFLIGGLALCTGFEARDAVIASTLARVGEMVAIFGLGAVFTHRLSRRALA